MASSDAASQSADAPPRDFTALCGQLASEDTVNDFVTRPIGVHIHANVYQANLQGAKAALRSWPHAGAVLNLCLEPVDHCRAENDLAVEDSAGLTAEAASSFVRRTSARIEELATRHSWVIVNCQAGINRSSAAVLGWLKQHRRFSLPRAKALVKSRKAEAARRLRLKNRYQSFKGGSATEHAFSWPTLCGRSAPVLSKALAAAGAPAAGRASRAKK